MNYRSTKWILTAVMTVVSVSLWVNGCGKAGTETPKSEKSKPTTAKPAAETNTKTAPAAVAVAEQTTCPVMDQPINKAVFVEYKGKKVYFCCPECKPTFEKDPEKYLGKLPQFTKQAP